MQKRWLIKSKRGLKVYFKTSYKYCICKDYIIIYKVEDNYLEIYRVINRYQDITRIFD